MKLYFVRHGKTQWNLESRYQGAGGDSPLLPESYQEMAKVADFLKGVRFEHVYSSPIRRASETAFHIDRHLKHRAPLSLDSRLREFNLGMMEGMKFSDIKKKYPDQFKFFRNHPDKYDPTSIRGESFNEAISRQRSKIDEITQNLNPDGNVLIVGHGAALNALINSLLGIGLKDLRKRGGLGNTSTTIVENNDKGKTFQLIDWNNTSYLDHAPGATDEV